MTYADIVNTVGVGLILLAFFLLTIGAIRGDHFLYLFLNVLGAALACYGSFLIRAVPFIVLEGTWTLVSSYGILKKIVARRQ